MNNFIKVLSLAFLLSSSFGVYAKHHSTNVKKINIDSQFVRLSDRYLDDYYFPNNPTLATQNGVHLYDAQLEDESQAGINHRISQLKSYENEVQSFPADKLSAYIAANKEILLNHIRGEILTLETIRPWEKDPDFYSSGITNAAFVIMEREYAPVDQRLKMLVDREKQMPQMLQEARKNIKNPPLIYTNIAIEQLPGIISFFRHDLPEAFEDAKNKELKKEFQTTNAQVVQALRNYQNWLKTIVLPTSTGDYRLGEETFKEKLQYDEMVDIPLPQLLKIGLDDLHKNQKELIKVAKEVYPDKNSHEAITELGESHLGSAQLLPAFTKSMDDLVAFINSHKIITIPGTTKPIVEETPPFLRATTFASMDTPGPFEKSKEAYFNVTLPNPSWNKTETEVYLQTFSKPAIVTTAIHEVFPGHYVQFLWMNKMHDRLRKVIYANSNAEGWAHYTEQMMMDQGYGNPQTREGKLLRLGQLEDALLRDSRYIVAIKMHTGKMTFDEAVLFFMNEGYQNKMAATMEVKRATSDPTYLYYTLGKLQILKLREDLQKQQGDAFNLQKFHDAFMAQGAPPIKIVRQALLPDESSTL